MIVFYFSHFFNRFFFVCILNIILYVKLNQAESRITLLKTSPVSYFSQFGGDRFDACPEDDNLREKLSALRKLISSGNENSKKVL